MLVTPFSLHVVSPLQEVAAWERRQSAATPPGPALQLSQTEYCQFRLEAVRPTTPTTLVLTFSLPEKGGLLGHGPGQHLVLQFTSAGELLIRQLSILSPPHSPGQFSLCLRVYPGGRLGGAATDWRPGTRLNMRGPFGYSHQAGQCERLLLLAQGTGIIPFFSIIQSELEGECRLRLLYSVSAREEIICEEELNELCGFWNFSARIFLGAGQEAGAGCSVPQRELVPARLTDQDIQQEAERDLAATRALVCGSKQYMDQVIDTLQQCGLSKENIVRF